MFEKKGVFWCLTRSGLKPKRSEKITGRIASDGMNASAVPGFGDTVEFRDQTAADAAPLGLRSDGQMPELNFGTSGTYSNQSSDRLSIFLSKQLEFLAFQAECVADIARQAQRLPQNYPKEFIQPCGSIGCRYDLYCRHASLVERPKLSDAGPISPTANQDVIPAFGVAGWLGDVTISRSLAELSTRRKSPPEQ